MSADTTVVYFHSAMTGAPSLAGQAGTLIAVLDACLVNGFGAGAVDSVVIAGGVATVTRSAGHSFEVGAVAEVSGASVSGGSINGRQKVLTVTASTWTFDATGLANQAATGAISAKLASAQWTKAFSGTNLAAYKSANPASTGCLLRVDDTGSTVGRVVGYESMTDVNTGTGPFPTSTQISGGGSLGKSSTADATARPWMIFADDRAFYICTNWSVAAGSWGTGTAFTTQCFGDINPFKTPDPYACVLNTCNGAPIGNNPGTANSFDSFYCQSGSEYYQYAPRAYTGIGTSKPVRRVAFGYTLVDGYMSGAATST